MASERLLPDWPFPAYAHVPGATPHPYSDPKGHRHPLPEVDADALEPSQWPQCAIYLHGIDLFEAGFFWEAHEAWEKLWHALGRRGRDADFVKGLIQLAVAGVKHRQELPDALRDHAKRAAELLAAGATEAETYRGVDVGRAIRWAEAIVANGWAGEPLKLVAARPAD